MPTRAALHDASARRHVCKSSLFQPVVKEQLLPSLERKGSFYIISALKNAVATTSFAKVPAVKRTALPLKKNYAT